jgi:ribosomal protein L37AE/L43A
MPEVMPTLQTSGKPEKDVCEICSERRWLRRFYIIDVCKECHAAFKRLFFP